MKLFSRKSEVPVTRKPDYDFITKLEGETSQDTDFDERYDEMLFDALTDRIKRGEIPNHLIETNLIALLLELHSEKVTKQVDSMLEEIRRIRWGARGYGSVDSAAARLREAMMRPKSLRNN